MSLVIPQIEMVGSWRLNERHYGALQGKKKKDTESIYGADQVKRWRRSYLESPPKLTSIGSDDRIQQVPTINGESLKDTYLRRTARINATSVYIRKDKSPPRK